MANFDLNPIFSNMMEWPPSHLQSDESNKDGYSKLGLQLGKNRGLSVKNNDFSELMNFCRRNFSGICPSLTDNLIGETIQNFLINYYPNSQKEKTSDDLLSLFNNFKREKVHVFVKVFNLKTDANQYDGGFFILFDPMYFIETHKNNLMYLQINEANTVNSDRIIHSGLVFKDVEILQEDKEGLKNIIQEKVDDFLNVVGIALGDKNSVQRLTTVFNSVDTEYHVLNKDMQETRSCYSSDGSTFLKGTINLKTELFFNNHKNLFNLLYKRDNNLHDKIYKSISWLGRSLRTENIGDSFLQVAVSLECLLTRQEKGSFISPSITYSLSEALSFLIGSTKEERMEKFKSIKNLYGLRSAIVHSGKSEITIKDYYDFFLLVRSGIYNILKLMEENKITQINEIYAYIDNIKFA